MVTPTSTVLAGYTVADVLLVLPIPAIIYLGIVDYRTRRIQKWVWYPLTAYAVAVAAFRAIPAFADGFGVEYVSYIAVSTVLLGGIGFGMALLGQTGLADAKFMAWVGLMYPLPTLHTAPVASPHLGLLSFTVLLNALTAAFVYFAVLAVYNVFRAADTPSLVALRVPVSKLDSVSGVLLVDGDSVVPTGADLDAYRMYLRWRGLESETLREWSDAVRHSVPVRGVESVGDGAVTNSLSSSPGLGDRSAAPHRYTDSDLWGVEEFVAAVGEPYGVSAESLTRSLEEVVSGKPVVWVAPGTPFLVFGAFGVVSAVCGGSVVSAAESLLELFLMPI